MITIINTFLVYGLAVPAAFSMIASFLAALYFSAARTVFVAARVAGPQIFLQGGQRPRRVQRNLEEFGLARRVGSCEFGGLRHAKK